MKILFYGLLVLVIIFLGCNNVKTIENDGGLKINLEINCIDFLKDICANPEDSIFQICLQKISSKDYNNIDEFSKSFKEAALELKPDIKLASFFVSLQNREKIGYNSTNEEVLSVIKSDLQKKIDATVINVTKRLEYFSDQPVIVKIIGFNKIQVEVPGLFEKQRICNYLQSTGDLGFWETYDNTEVYTYLDAANKIIAENGPCIDRKSIDTLNIDHKLIDELNENNKQVQEEFKLKNPLFSLLIPAVNVSNLQQGPCIGYCESKDTAYVIKLLKMRIVRNCFPRDLKFCWSIKSNKENPNIFELIAIRSSLDGNAPLGGEVITEASSETDKNYGGATVSIEMNSEGARKWERLTADNIGKNIAIIIDNYVYSYPVVQSEIKEGKSSISGNFTIDEAKDMAYILKAGRYPVKLTVTSVEIKEPIKK